MRTVLLAAMSALLPFAAIHVASATPLPFSDSTQGFATFTAPSTGTYDIVAFGAQGGAGTFLSNPGGLGAKIGGDVMLTAGEVLTIAVGASGNAASNYNAGPYQGGGGGGGGGTFVVGPNSTPLIIAGGGGGGGQGGPGGSGQSGTSGQGVIYVGTFVFGGGSNGSGGSTSLDGGGGGGGFNGDGFAATRASGGAGYPSLAGRGGSFGYGGSGGFGGGGGGDGGDGSGFEDVPGEFTLTGGGGGGGGYSGGAGGNSAPGTGTGGGGGGSFDAGLIDANLILVSGVNRGNGSVTITELPPNSVSEPASLALLVTSFVGLLAARRRRRRAVH